MTLHRRWLAALLLAVAIPLAPGATAGAGAQTATPQPAPERVVLGTLADVTDWVEAQGLAPNDVGRIGGARWWNALRDGLLIEWSGTRRAVSVLTIQADLPPDDPASTDDRLGLVRAWLDRFGPGSDEFLTLLLRYPPIAGQLSARQMDLGDRILQVWLVDQGARLTLTLRLPDRRYGGITPGSAVVPCRGLDAATGTVAQELEVELEARVRADATADPGWVWMIMDEPDHRDGVAQLARADWKDPVSGYHAETGTLLLRGPRLAPGQELDLRWVIRYPDDRDHWLQTRIVIAPELPLPLSGDDASRLRDLPAIGTWPARYLASDPCPGLPGAPPPGADEAREHLEDATDRLWAINERIATQMSSGQGSSIDDQLRPIEDLDVWAVDEVAWASDLDPALLQRNVALRDWRAAVNGMAVLSKQVLATRGFDPTEVRSVLELLGHLLLTVGPRAAMEVVDP